MILESAPADEHGVPRDEQGAARKEPPGLLLLPESRGVQDRFGRDVKSLDAEPMRAVGRTTILVLALEDAVDV